MTTGITRIVGTHHHVGNQVVDLETAIETIIAGGLASGTILGITTALFDASGLTDGAATVFEVGDYFYEDSSRVWLNGLLQRPILDYTERSAGGDMFDAITMTAAPVSGDELLIEYEVIES